MTRINCVSVKELCNQHLFAEWREMPRLIKYIARSLDKPGFSEDEIPDRYVMGTGHVKFFYNKLEYITNRHNDLTEELLSRGYKIVSKPLTFKNVPEHWNNDWEPTQKDININKDRILERMPRNPKW